MSFNLITPLKIEVVNFEPPTLKSLIPSSVTITASSVTTAHTGCAKKTATFSTSETMSQNEMISRLISTAKNDIVKSFAVYCLTDKIVYPFLYAFDILSATASSLLSSVISNEFMKLLAESNRRGEAWKKREEATVWNFLDDVVKGVGSFVTAIVDGAVDLALKVVEKVADVAESALSKVLKTPLIIILAIIGIYVIIKILPKKKISLAKSSTRLKNTTKN